jgi:hypothetical protein
MEVTFWALDAKAFRAQCVEVRTAGEKRHVGAGRGKASAKIPSDSAAADDRDAHGGWYHLSEMAEASRIGNRY